MKKRRFTGSIEVQDADRARGATLPAIGVENEGMPVDDDATRERNS
jgi:hypothetical protein